MAKHLETSDKCPTCGVAYSMEDLTEFSKVISLYGVDEVVPDEKAKQEMAAATTKNLTDTVELVEDAPQWCMLVCHGDGGTTGNWNGRKMDWFVSQRPNGDIIKEFKCKAGPLHCNRTVPYEKVLNWTIKNSATLMKKCHRHGILKIVLFDVPRATATHQCATVDEEAQAWVTTKDSKIVLTMPNANEECRSYGHTTVDFLNCLNDDYNIFH
jgi:hypothetical protein